VARSDIRLASDVADTSLVVGDLSLVARQVQALKEGIRRGAENCAFLNRQLAIEERRVGKLLQRSTFAPDVPESQVLSQGKDGLRIDLAPLYQAMAEKSEEETDQALTEFFTKGVIGVLARLNRSRIEGKPGRQRMFLKLSHNLHALFLQTRERDRAQTHLAALRESFEQAATEIAEHHGELHVAGELLPGTDLTAPQAVVKRQHNAEVVVESVSARMVVRPGADDDHLELALTNTRGSESDQTVEALNLQATSFRLQDGRITWEGQRSR
jgi:hypothetical protein